MWEKYKNFRKGCGPRGLSQGPRVSAGGIRGWVATEGEKVIVVGLEEAEALLRLPSQLGGEQGALAVAVPGQGDVFPVGTRERAGGRGPLGAFVHLALQHKSVLPAEPAGQGASIGAGSRSMRERNLAMVTGSAP